MKVLQVNKYYWPWVGGIETLNKELAESLVKEGNIVQVLSCQFEKSLPAITENIEGVKVYRAKIFGKVQSMPLSFSFFPLFKKLSKDADLIILHHPFPLGFAAALLYAKNKKIVVWYHSDIVRQKFLGFLFRPFIRSVLSRCFKIIIHGKKFAETSDMLQAYQSKCAVVSFGIDMAMTESILASEKEKIMQIREQFSQPIILAAGRLVYYKGYEVLIDAMKNVSKDSLLLIIGEGSLKNKLNEQIIKNNLSERIKITPPVSELLPYMSACEIFVLPSIAKSEAFGIVQLEAMSCAKPVINTDLGNEVPNVSINGLSGITVQPGNSKALAQAINSLLENPELRKKYGQAGKLRVEAVYSKENFLKSFQTAILKP